MHFICLLFSTMIYLLSSQKRANGTKTTKTSVYVIFLIVVLLSLLLLVCYNSNGHCHIIDATKVMDTFNLCVGSLTHAIVSKASEWARLQEQLSPLPFPNHFGHYKVCLTASINTSSSVRHSIHRISISLAISIRSINRNNQLQMIAIEAISLSLSPTSCEWVNEAMRHTNNRFRTLNLRTNVVWTL